MSIFFRGIFEEVDMIDNALADAVNYNMCSNVCKCLNDENETIKKIYFQETEATFNKYKRTKIDKTPHDNDLRPLLFQTDKFDKGYDSMMSCYVDMPSRKIEHKDNQVMLDQISSIE